MEKCRKIQDLTNTFLISTKEEEVTTKYMSIVELANWISTIQNEAK